MAIKITMMRQSALVEITKLFPGVGPEALEEYVTSVVRQGVTNDLRAGVFTLAVNYWIHLAEQGGNVIVGLEVSPSNMRQCLGPWLALERDLPEIVRQLTIAQNATFVNAEGVTARVTADPKEHSFRFVAVEDDDNFE